MTITSDQPTTTDELPADHDCERWWNGRRWDAVRRPWTVTVASLLAFAFGILKMLVVLLGLVVLEHWNVVRPYTTLSRGHICCELLVAAVLGVALLWAGFAAWRGLDDRALFLSAAGVVFYQMISPLFAGAHRGAGVLSWYDLGLLIVALLATRSSREYFRS